MRKEKGSILMLLPIFILLASIGIFVAASDNATITKSYSAVQESAKGVANDGLTAALSTISMDFYITADSNAKMEDLFKDTSKLEKDLEAQMGSYYDNIEVSSDGTITFEDDDGNEYKAKVNKSTLSVESFEMN